MAKVTKRKYVLGLIFDPLMEKVLLVKKNNPRWQRDKWNGIGGKIEKIDHHAAQSMGRESLEEINRDFSWRFFALLTGDDFEVHCFYAITPTEEFKTQVGELPMMLPVDHLPTSTMPNIPWLIEMAKSMSRGEHADHFVVTERTEENYEG